MNSLRKVGEILEEEGIKSLVLRIVRKAISSFFHCCYYLELFFYKNIFDKGYDFTIHQIITADSLSFSADTTPSMVVKNFMEHKFDLLGSGWTKVEYGMHCRGLDGFYYRSEHNPQIDPEGKWLEQTLKKSHRRYSKHIWTLIDPTYHPIDWQIDFKSGYRWSEKIWFKNITHGKIKGVDIKVPWELSRMQHLPLLAKKYVNQDTSVEEKKLLSSEFRNQVLDFIATNPLGYGVNWNCSMDIAIRASNLLLSYDIFCSGGCKFDPEFTKYFTKSIFEHGLHISKNLEWNFGQRGNHYLSNLAGLTFISIYLGKSKITDKWLAFSIEQLIKEIDYQFNDDGTNFEGSTAYHRLSTELVLYSFCLILGLEEPRLEDLNKAYIRWPNIIKLIKKSSLDFTNLKITEGLEIKSSPFPASHLEKLKKMIEFIWYISKTNGCLPQIGDNDSGRLFKLEPEYQIFETKEIVRKFKNLENYPLDQDCDIYPFEDTLNVSKFLKTDITIDASIDSKDIDCDHTFELKILASILGKNSQFLNFIIESSGILESTEISNNRSSQNELKQLANSNTVSWEYTHSRDLTENMAIYYSQDFGIYIFRSDLLFLSIRAWSGKRIHGGHNHFDQLSIELSIEGKDIIRDPGTYNYTALEDKRWLYRSADSHFSPFSDDIVPTKVKKLPFSSVDMPPVTIILFDKSNFKASFNFDDQIYFYEMKLLGNRILIKSSRLGDIDLGSSTKVSPSLGYGIILNNDTT